MAEGRNNTVLLVGAVIALLGVAALAVPSFSTYRNRDVVKLGDLKVTTKEETEHDIPPFVGPAALGIGIVLIGAGLYLRR